MLLRVVLSGLTRIVSESTFLEMGAAPRPSRIIYDRAESAMAKLQPRSIEWPAVFSSAKWFYVTGITAALSPSAAAATLEALQIAKQTGLTTLLDPTIALNSGPWIKPATEFAERLNTSMY